MANKPFGLAVRAVVLDDKGRCLLLRRSPNNKTNIGRWELPGGKVEPGEDFVQALKREVKEEAGVNISITKAVGIVQIELPSLIVVQVIMEARLVSGLVSLSKEHNDFIWLDRAQLPDMNLIKEFYPFARLYSKTEGKRED